MAVICAQIKVIIKTLTTKFAVVTHLAQVYERRAYNWDWPSDEFTSSRTEKPLEAYDQARATSKHLLNINLLLFKKILELF